ncbi:phosphatidylinositol 4-kinase beta 1-like [Zingiber officinale]|uniref:phosphatidylinositol 4-kinase beta 1-like n=1 Tax=Zingiber officinale TaxID=94328 RepID=UPI001C4A9F2B|nr:phosphatidylinositol 4-kinase beta 1-like [Zingiber officinale]
MVRFLGLRSFSLDQSPREITRTGPVSGRGNGGAGGENGWLIRFFDSAFFCEWIAVSYLYKHDHDGVRDYLCNRMYTLPLMGIESYLFQICYMLVHKPSPSLDRFVIDTCSKSLWIALKVHWFLMAELEDSEDNEGIGLVQEKCQIAATVMGEWPLLVKLQPVPPSTPASPKSNPVLNRIFSSKQKLLSLASSSSSPTSGSSPLFEGSNRVDSSSDAIPEENKLLKKLIMGSKMRDAFFSRKSSEKDEEESGKGFFKRLLRDSNDKEEDTDKDGFFRRFLRDSKDDDGELTSSSEGFLKRLFRDKEERMVEDYEKEGFFRRMFKDKNEEKKHSGINKNQEEEKASENIEVDEKENFFRRLFKEKHEERKDANRERNVEKEKSDVIAQEEEKESFFGKIFTDKNDEKKDIRYDVNEEKEKVQRNLEVDDKDGFFHRIFKEKSEEKKDGSFNRNEEEERKSIEDDNIFRRLFKDKNEGKKVVGNDNNEDDKVNGSIKEREREGFFHRLFKEKHDDKKIEGHDRNEEDGKSNEILEEEGTSEILSFRRLFRIHPEESKVSSISENGTFENSPGTENFFRRLFKDRDRSIEDSELLSAKIRKEKHPGSQYNERGHDKPPLPNNTIAESRKSSYYASLEFVQLLSDTSYGLVDIYPIDDRKIALRESLTEVNSHVAEAQKCGGVCFPMGKGMFRVVNIPLDEAVLLNSREKAPYLICVEVLKCETLSRAKTTDAQKFSRGGIPLANGDAQLRMPPPWAYPLWSQNNTCNYDSDGILKSTSRAIDQAMARLWEAKVKYVHVSLSLESKIVQEIDSVWKIQPDTLDGDDRRDKSITIGEKTPEWITVNLSAIPGVNMEDVEDQEPSASKDHRRVPSTTAIEEVKAAAAKGQTAPGLPVNVAGQNSQDTKPKLMDGVIRKPGDALSGELWEKKKEQIRRSSAFGKLPGWDLRSIIVKSGDDCRQEHLAVQLVSHFYDIYQEAGLPLWLRPYEVLVTSSYTALIETIPDTASIHSIKSRFPNISSLRDFFIAKYGENSSNFRLAQRNFVESMAGYSILCYLLQVKDRHNGNILLDEEGHIIHIDFGFMLSNSPGSVNFESAPFKLTRELLEVMDSDAEGNPSEFFDYFKVLCIQGFLTCRKHAEHIILLVEMLQDSGFPCFRGGTRTIQNLRKRFNLSLTEEQCVSLVLSLISSSLDAWRTRQYDYYQRVLNGIL